MRYIGKATKYRLLSCPRAAFVLRYARHQTAGHMGNNVISHKFSENAREDNPTDKFHF